MSKRRIIELTYAYSLLTGVSIQESRKSILSTPTGKAILNGNRFVLYEQDTANLYNIAEELDAIRRYNISTRDIELSISKAEKIQHNVPLKYSAACPAKKRAAKIQLIHIQKKRMDERRKRDDQIIALRRTIHAD